MDMLSNKNVADEGFSVKQTNIAKGIACILLLTHHLFYSPNSYAWWKSLFMMGNEPIESVVAVLCRVCVTIFLLLSGYGVNEVLNKKLSAETGNGFMQILRTSLRFVWKLWAGYAVVFVLFVPWQSLFGRHPYTSALDFALDFAGLSDLFGSPTMNATWWYMSLALVSYALVPFFKPLLRKTPELSFVVAMVFFALFLLRGGIFQSYVFMFGMILSEMRVFNRLGIVKKKASYRWVVCIAFVLIAAVLRYITVSWMDIVFAISIIMLSYVCLSTVKFLSVSLEFVGKHSANIFFFHSFLYLYNFRSFVYAPKYAPLILVAFIAECLLISMVLEGLKKLLFIQKGIDYIGNLIGGKVNKSSSK